MSDSSQLALAQPVSQNASANNQDILTAAKGSGIIFFGDMFSYASRFVFGVIMARAIGADGYGLYDLGVTAALILTGIATLGFPGGILRFMPAAIRERNKAHVWEILQVSLGVSLSLSLIMALATFGLADWLAASLFHEPNLAPMLRIASLTIPLTALARIFMATIRAFKRMQYQVYADSFLANTSKILLTVLFLGLGMGAAGALWAYVLAWIAEVGLLFYYVNRLFSLRRPPRTFQHKTRELVSFSLPLWLTEITTTFGRQIELLLLGILGTVASVGVYSASLRIQMVGGMLLTAVQVAAKPIISDLHLRDEHSQLQKLYRTLTKWSLSFNLPFFLTTVIFARPVLAIFGEDFTAGVPVLIIVALGTIVQAGTGICGSMISMTGHSKLSFYNSLFSLALTLALDFIFIRIWGMVGAAIATALVIALMSLVRMLQVYWLLKLWPFDVAFIKPVIASVAALIVGWAANYIMPAERNLFFLVFDIALLWLGYGAAVLLLGLSEEDQIVIRRVKQQFATRLRPRKSSS